jgi:ABC-type microcin C transport system duplicated ATPase subunit YejF
MCFAKPMSFLSCLKDIRRHVSEVIAIHFRISISPWVSRRHWMKSHVASRKLG